MKTLPFSDVKNRFRDGAQPAVAAIKKRVQARSALALTLAADQVLVALVRRSGDGHGSIVPAKKPVTIGAEEIYRNPERAGAVLAEALDAAGLREKRCVVTVPPSWVLTASTELPEVGTEDLRGYLELRAEREFSIPPGELRLGYCPYKLPDGTRRATLAALPSKRLEAVEAMLAAANGRRAVSVSLAIGGGLGDPRSTLHLVSDGGRTEVVVTAGGGVAALRSLPGPVMGRNEDGENGEVAHVFDPAAFCREVRITVGRLPSALQEQVREVHFGGAREAAALVRAEAGEGLRRMGFDPALGESPNDAAPAAQEAAALLLRREPVPFEFIVPQPRRWEAALRRFNTPRGRKIAGAVLAVIFLPLFAFFVRSQEESHLAADWRGMNANVADLDELQQRIRRFRPWFDRTPAAVQLLESLFAAFPEAGDVWAKSIIIKGATVTCTGFARDQSALSGLRERLRTRSDVSELHTQQVRGENPVQFILVYHWEVSHDK